MLKTLFSKIKSEKAANSSNHSHELSINSQKQETTSTEELLHYEVLAENALVASEAKKIRYIAYQSFPSIYNKVLACTVSTFNLLPYAKRKVKEIDL